MALEVLSCFIGLNSLLFLSSFFYYSVFHFLISASSQFLFAPDSYFVPAFCLIWLRLFFLISKYLNLNLTGSIFPHAIPLFFFDLHKQFCFVIFQSFFKLGLLSQMLFHGRFVLAFFASQMNPSQILYQLQNLSSCYNPQCF